jgi:hypothetical protein
MKKPLVTKSNLSDELQKPGPDSLDINEDDSKSAKTDPVKEALAKVEAVVSKTDEYFAKDPNGNGAIGDSVSLKQVIDQMEKRLISFLGLTDSKSTSLPEELESLDIEADLGRPDGVEESPVPPDAVISGEIDKEVKKSAPRIEEPWDAPTEMEGLRFADGVRTMGNLSKEPLWMLLLDVYVARRDGVLFLERRGVERRLAFRGGGISSATSTAPEDRLVELLHREGRLKDDDYTKAHLAVGASERRVGQILAERGIISSRELFPLVRHHYESIIFDSFKWREGIWRFESGKKISKERIVLDVSTPFVIFEGMRSTARLEDIDEIAPTGCRPLAVPSGVCQVQDLSFGLQEIEIRRACDGYLTVDELAENFDISISEMKRFVAGLLMLGLLTINSLETYRQSMEDGL